MNVFLDTNVLMDVLVQRQPFFAQSRKVWYLAESGKIRGLISAVSFPNTFYIVRKLRGRQAAITMMNMLRDTFTVVACDEQLVSQAIDADFADFEDALQFFSALRARAARLVTRNPAHFPRSELPVLSPAEFLATHSFT